MHQNKHFFSIVALVAVLVILFTLKGGALFSGVDKNTYQAVFLTNNQMYFGKLSNLNGKYVKLSDIYYLKENPKDQTPPLTLIKFGTQEIQQPQDAMYINRDHMLLWENLRADGQVIQLIGQQKLQAQTPPAAANPAPAASVAVPIK